MVFNHPSEALKGYPNVKYQKRAKNPDTVEATQRYYIKNSELLPEVLRSKSLGRITNELAIMLMMLTRRYASRPCFNNYSYKEDMIAEALANLCKNALQFDPDRYSTPNPFAYYTTCINNTFLQFLNVEKSHRRTRDKLLVEMGENPSFNFLDEHRQQHEHGGEYTSELADLKSQIEDAKLRVAQDAIDAARKAQLIEEAANRTQKMASAETESTESPVETELDKLEVPASSLLIFGDSDTNEETSDA